MEIVWSGYDFFQHSIPAEMKLYELLIFNKMFGVDVIFLYVYGYLIARTMPRDDVHLRLPNIYQNQM
jgi:hypothetical protein